MPRKRQMVWLAMTKGPPPTYWLPAKGRRLAIRLAEDDEHLDWADMKACYGAYVVRAELTWVEPSKKRKAKR